MARIFVFLVLGILTLCAVCVSLEDNVPTIVYEWETVDMDWPNETIRQDYYQNNKYQPKNNGINGIKLYNGTVYLTIPKLKDGVPFSLVEVKHDRTNSPLLQPYPNWDIHMDGDCSKFKLIQSMEIDPYTGHMWIIDTAFVPRGAVSVPDPCPKKLVIWNLRTNTEVHRYSFPSSVIGLGMSYLNDIVIDFDTNRTARWAYISDTLGKKLIVYDRLLDASWAFSHQSMNPETQYGSITIGNVTSNYGILGINGIALSSDLRYVYYCPVAGITLYRVSTKILRNKLSTATDFANDVKSIGSKRYQSDGIYYGQKHNLYYSAQGPRSVFRWPVLDGPGALSRHTAAFHNRIEWIDSLAFDDDGFLWFVTNNLNTFFTEGGHNGTSNYFVWKVFVDDASYLKFGTDTSSAVTCIVSITALLLSMVVSI